VLWVFTSRTNEARFLEMMRTHGDGAKAFVLTQVIDGIQGSRMPSNVWTDLYHKPWTRAFHGEVLLTND